MPYNTRRKSLSLPSLGIHIPTTHAARAAAAAAAAASRGPSRPSTASSASLSPPPASASRSPESHPNKRIKRSHADAASASSSTAASSAAAAADSEAIEQTPPPSPTPATSVDMTDSSDPPLVDLEGINDDIVEAVIVQLQSTANRPHLVKELETVLSQRLSSVQNSANPCAIISSRLASYMKRPRWTALAPCPLAKELETVHPRRTYFFLTTYPRQPLPEHAASQPTTTVARAVITPSVSLTDDSGSDDVDSRRRDLSPSPEIDLSPPEFDDVDDDAMPITPIGSRATRHLRDLRHDSPPLEKDEREFTQTADVLQKRKLSDALSPPEATERNATMEYGYRDDMWFSENRAAAGTTFLTSPSIKPSIMSSARKEDESESWLKLNKLLEWDKGAESIEIDELDCLLDTC